MKGCQIIYNQLLRKGVKDVFLYSGGAVMSLIDTFYKQDEIQYYINSNEHNGCNAAIGYAKSSNQTGVMITTSGPGLTNCVTSILDSQNDSSPLVVISGQVSKQSMGTQAFQECPAVEITKPITKWSVEVQDVNELEYIINKAFFIANDQKKGVVHIDVPKCVFNDTTTSPQQQSIFVKEPSTTYCVDDIMDIINQSERPVCVLGKGAIHIPRLIKQFVTMCNIPVTTTMHAMGVYPEDEYLSLGMCGMHGLYSANMALQHSDCIINIGARFDDRIIGKPDTYAPQAKHIIQCNISQKEFHINIDPTHIIHQDAKIFVKDCIPQHKYQFRKGWMKQIKSWKRQHPLQYNQDTHGRLKTQDVLKAIDQYKNPNDIFTFGVGNHLMMGCQYLTWMRPKKIIASGSLGVMGCSIGYAIGTQIANPNHTVISIDGDGSFNMTLSDLQTIQRYQLPIKIAIINDESLSMVQVWEKLFYGERYTATSNPNNPDYVALAESYGIKAMYCDHVDDVHKCVQTFLQENGPVLCEFKTLGEECLPLVAPGKSLDNMILFNDKVMDIGTGEAPT